MKNFFAPLAITFTILLSGCGGANGQGQGGSQGAAPVVSPQANEVIYLLSADVPTLDPQAANNGMTARVTMQIFESLTSFDDERNVVPNLATSFEMLEDGTWQFTLREGVYFHDGSYFNAHVAKMNIDRMIDPSRGFPTAFMVEMIEEVTVVDEYTIHIATEFPFAPLPSHFTHFGTFMHSPLSIEAEANGANIADYVVGTGPFKFVSFEPSLSVHMVRNPNHWQVVPEIEYLTFLIVPEPSTRMNMLISGEANALVGQPANVPALDSYPQVDLMLVNTNAKQYIGFNVLNPPFDDIRVRQAIAMLIDRDDIITAAAEGLAVAGVGPIPYGVVGSPQGMQPLPQDTDRALQLLQEAGVASGFDTELHIFGGNVPQSITASYLQAILAPLGINISIYQHEVGAFLEMMDTGNYSGMFIGSWTTISWDADYALYPLFHSSQAPMQGRWTQFTNPVLDSVLDQARQTPDQTERNSLYRQASEILIYEAPIVVTHYPIQPFLTNGIEGVIIRNGTLPYFHSVRMK